MWRVVESESMQRVVKSEPHQIDYPNWITNEPFIRVARTSIIEPYNFWNLKSLLIKSLVCLSMFISYLSFSSCDFHSCGCTHVECYSLELLHNPVTYCKCKLTLVSSINLVFYVRSNLLEKSITIVRIGRVSSNNNKLLFWSLSKCKFIWYKYIWW